MPSWLRLIAFQSVFSFAASVAIRLTAGYQALDFGADPALLGLVASSFAVPALVIAVPAGRMSSRFGGAWVIATGLILQLVGAFGCWLSPVVVGFVIACAVCGAGHAMVLVGQQSVVAERAARSRDGAFGTLTTGSSIGQLIAPPAIGMLAALSGTGDAGVESIGLGAAITSAIIGLILITLFICRVSAPPTDEPPTRSVVAAIRESSGETWRAIVVSGLVLASVDLLYAFIPYWASSREIDVTVVGWLLAVRAAVTVVSRIGLGRLVARFGRKTVLLIAILLATAGFAVLPFGGLIGAFVAMVVLGVGLGVPQPLTTSWALATVPHAHRNMILGLRLTTNRFAQGAIPVSIGALGGLAGPDGVLLLNASLLLVAAVAVVGSRVADSTAS
ncbi:MAG: MFS transporter [Protaetiibacter sp.]